MERVTSDISLQTQTDILFSSMLKYVQASDKGVRFLFFLLLNIDDIWKSDDINYICAASLRETRQMPVNYTHMLLPVRKDLPETREELNPCPFSQRCGDVTELHQSVQKCPRLTRNKGQITATGCKLWKTVILCLHDSNVLLSPFKLRLYLTTA